MSTFSRPQRFPYVVACLLSLSISLLTSACGVVGSADYQPPFVPIEFVIDTQGNISVQVSASLATPIGTFGVGAAAENTVQPPSGGLVMFIEHLIGGQPMDTGYQVSEDASTKTLVIDGTVTIEFTGNLTSVNAIGHHTILLTTPGHQPSQQQQPVQSTPTDTPVPQKPAPGSILYRANWSNDVGGWSADSNWSWLRGALVTNGQSYGDSFTDGTAFPPYQPGMAIADYEIVARIQVISVNLGNSGFGLIARLTSDTSGSSANGYVAGLDKIDDQSPFAALADIHSGIPFADPCCVQSTFYAQTPFTPGTDWHTYVLKVQANHIAFYIDGALVGQATDNQFLSGGRVGLESHQCQITVSSFEVIAE